MVGLRGVRFNPVTLRSGPADGGSGHAKNSSTVRSFRDGKRDVIAMTKKGRAYGGRKPRLGRTGEGDSEAGQGR
jgi:hypothetical protein